MGDNRNNSYDSRHWGKDGTLNTFVPNERILGRGLFRYYPGIKSLNKKPDTIEEIQGNQMEEHQTEDNPTEEVQHEDSMEG